MFAGLPEASASDAIFSSLTANFSRSIPYSRKEGTSSVFVRRSSAPRNFFDAQEGLSVFSALPISYAIFAKRSSAPSPSSAKRRHSVMSIAFEIPCGTWKSAPIGRLIP